MAANFPPTSYKLPTFNLQLRWYQLDPIARTWALQAQPLAGQVYTPLRSQDDSESGLLYLEFSKEANVLHDVADYHADGDADVVQIEFPAGTGELRYYKVADVSPRWLGFVNEHLHATLQRLTPAELVRVIGPEPPPQPPLDALHLVVEYVDDQGVSMMKIAAATSPAAFVQSAAPSQVKIVHFWRESENDWADWPDPAVIDSANVLLGKSRRRTITASGLYRIEGCYRFGMIQPDDQGSWSPLPR